MTVLSILHCTWTVVCVTSQRWKVSGYHAQKTLLPLCRKIRNHKSPKMKRLYSGHHPRSSLAARSVESLIKFNVFSMRLKLNHDTNNIHDRHALHTSFNSFDFVFEHFLQLLPFSWTDWANKILTNIWRTIHLPLQKYTFNMPNY